MTEFHKRFTIDSSTKRGVGKGSDPSLVGGSRLYDTKRWKESWLRHMRSFPLCQTCQESGQITAAQVVDHIEPHRGDVLLFWDESNWQSLCKRCHDLKTASETRGVSRYPRMKTKPQCSVTLVSGPPGCGAQSWVEDKAPTLVIDMHATCIELYGKPEHELSKSQARLALVERNSRLFGVQHLPPQAHAYLIDPSPRWSDRRHWVEQLGCEVVVLEIEEHAIDPAFQELAKAWWSCYSTNDGDTVLRKV